MNGVEDPVTELYNTVAFTAYASDTSIEMEDVYRPQTRIERVKTGLRNRLPDSDRVPPGLDRAVSPLRELLTIERAFPGEPGNTKRVEAASFRDLQQSDTLTAYYLGHPAAEDMKDDLQRLGDHPYCRSDTPVPEIYVPDTEHHHDLFDVAYTDAKYHEEHITSLRQFFTDEHGHPVLEPQTATDLVERVETKKERRAAARDKYRENRSPVKQTLGNLLFAPVNRRDQTSETGKDTAAWVRDTLKKMERDRVFDRGVSDGWSLLRYDTEEDVFLLTDVGKECLWYTHYFFNSLPGFDAPTAENTDYQLFPPPEEREVDYSLAAQQQFLADRGKMRDGFGRN